MKILLVLAALVLLAQGLSATAIVAFRSSSRIVVASDALEQTVHGTSDVVVRRLVCKVKQGGLWWATSGGYARSVTPPLDLLALVANVISSALTMNDVRHAIVDTVYPRVADALKTTRDLRGFGRFFDQGDFVSTIIVAGFDTNDPTPKVGVLGIVLEQLEPFRLTPTWAECPGRLCADGMLYFGASVAGPTVQLVTSPRPDWVEKADAAAARRIIAAQIAATPADVAAPIDVVEISARGARWVQRDPSSTCLPVSKG